MVKKMPFYLFFIFILILAITSILFSVQLIGTSYSLQTYDDCSIESLVTIADNYTPDTLKQRTVRINLFALPYSMQCKIISNPKISYFVLHANLCYQIQRLYIHIARLKAG